MPNSAATKDKAVVPVPVPDPSSESMPQPVQIHVPESEHPMVSMTQVASTPEPNNALGLGRIFGPIAQFGAVGLMGLVFWNMQRDSTSQNREMHTDLMGVLNKSLDRIDVNQNENRARFETIQQDSSRRMDKSDEKFEKVFDEIKTGRKEMGDKLDKMIQKMGP